jgi:hypothetical protein
MYVPGTVNVMVQDWPADNIPELNVATPLGTLVEVTVCAEVSLLVHITVLFTPRTRVALPGEYPDMADLDPSEKLPPAPFGIEIGNAFAGAALLLEDVVLLLRLAELEVVEEAAPPPPPPAFPPDPATTITVPIIVDGCTTQ